MNFQDLSKRKLQGRLVVDGHDITELMGQCHLVLIDVATRNTVLSINLQGGAHAKLARVPVTNQDDSAPTGDICGNCRKYSNDITYLGNEATGILALCATCRAVDSLLEENDKDFLAKLNVKWD